MNEDAIGLKRGLLLNFGANLIKDGMEHIINGLPEENLCVFASWRETQTPRGISADFCNRLSDFGFGFRPSDFGFLSDFGSSDFGF